MLCGIHKSECPGVGIDGLMFELGTLLKEILIIFKTFLVLWVQSEMCGCECHKGHLMAKQMVWFSMLISRQVLSLELSL